MRKENTSNKKLPKRVRSKSERLRGDKSWGEIYLGETRKRIWSTVHHFASSKPYAFEVYCNDKAMVWLIFYYYKIVSSYSAKKGNGNKIIISGIIRYVFRLIIYLIQINFASNIWPYIVHNTEVFHLVKTSLT